MLNYVSLLPASIDVVGVCQNFTFAEDADIVLAENTQTHFVAFFFTANLVSLYYAKVLHT